MSEWQPIKTAPKREAVIIYADGIVGEGDWKYYGEDEDQGWWWANLDDEYGQRIYPTHWMPLPEPPK